MKKAFVIIIFVFTIVACNKKAMPVISDRTVDPPPPVSPVANVKPDMTAGKTIFTNRCGRCHDLPDPVKYTEQRWEGILKTMVPRAGLNRVQELHVTAYLKANAAK